MLIRYAPHMNSIPFTVARIAPVLQIHQLTNPAAIRTPAVKVVATAVFSVEHLLEGGAAGVEVFVILVTAVDEASDAMATCVAV